MLLELVTNMFENQNGQALKENVLSSNFINSM